MPDPGSLAELGGDLIAFAAFVRSARSDRGQDFFHQLERESGRSGEALLALMEREDLYSEIVERGIEAAARSSSASKRQLLARVVASALAGTGHASPDPQLLLVKTVDAIEPVHVQLLVLLSCPVLGEGDFAGTQWEGRYTENDIANKWPDLKGLVRPILAVLDREGLVETAGQGIYDTIGDNFAPSPWGRLLLSFLTEDELDGALLGAAAITCRYRTEPSPVVVVRNLGPGRATNVRVSIPSADGRSILGRAQGQAPPVLPFELDPLMERDIDVETPTLTSGPPYDVHLTWEDVRGTNGTVATVRRDER